MYDKKSLDTMAQRYKDEMMRLYKQNKTISQPASSSAQKLPESPPLTEKPPIQSVKQVSPVINKPSVPVSMNNSAEKVHPISYNELMKNTYQKSTSDVNVPSEYCEGINCKFPPASEIMKNAVPPIITGTDKKSIEIPPKTPTIPLPETPIENMPTETLPGMPSELPSHSVTNRDEEDTYTTEDDGTTYEEDMPEQPETTEPGEVIDADMPQPPDIETPPEVIKQLEENRAMNKENTPAQPGTTEPGEENDTDMPQSPDIETSPEVTKKLEENKAMNKESTTAQPGATEESNPMNSVPPPGAIREKPSDIESDFTSELVNVTGDTDTGYLQVEVTTADNAVPIKDAVVIISRQAGGKNYLLSILTTDSSGRTPAVNLPAPPKGSPDETDIVSPKAMHADYQVRVDAEGFYPAYNTSVPVFSFVKSIQPFELIPLPEYTVQPAQTSLKMK